MFSLIIPKSNLKLGHVGSKTRSLGQTLDKPCVHSRGHRLEQKSMKLCQTVKFHKSKSSSKLSHVGSKTWSLGQMMKNLMYTREDRVLFKDSFYFARMLIFIKSRSISKH